MLEVSWKLHMRQSNNNFERFVNEYSSSLVVLHISIVCNYSTNFTSWKFVHFWSSNVLNYWVILEEFFWYLERSLFSKM